MSDTTSNSNPQNHDATSDSKGASSNTGASTGIKRYKGYTSPTKNLSGSQISIPPEINESTFVTPGIFRRKISKPRRAAADSQEQNVADKNDSDQQQQRKFRWSIEQMAVLRPVNIDESELSLPPDDWELSRQATDQSSHALEVEQFWTKNTHIVPSPDVLHLPASMRSAQPTVILTPDSTTSSNIVGNRSTDINSSVGCPSSLNSRNVCSPSFLMTSPCSPEFESTRNHPKVNNDENISLTRKHALNSGVKYYQLAFSLDDTDFEELERSLSLGPINGDDILADLGDENGGFKRRRSSTAPTETESSENGGQPSSGKGTAGGGSEDAEEIVASASSGANSNQQISGDSTSSGFSSWTIPAAQTLAKQSAEFVPPFMIDASPIKPDAIEERLIADMCQTTSEN